MTKDPTSSAQKYEEVVAAIVKAVPCSGGLGADTGKYFLFNGRGTLEDVLRAMQVRRNYPEISFGLSKVMIIKRYSLVTHDVETLAEWHLGKSLEWHRDNAPAVIDFLHSLLHD